MRSKILAPLAVVAVALTASSTSSAQQAQGASASAGFSTSSGFAGTSSGPSADGDPAKKTVLPIVVGGLGAAQLIAGTVLLVAAPSMPANCDEGTRTCVRKPGQSEASFQQDQQDAGDSQQMSSWGLIGVASGGVFLVAGAAMWLWYHRDVGAKSASAKPIVVPYAGANGGGLAAVATF